MEERIMSLNLVKLACEVAYDANKEETKSTQINQLIEVFESESGEMSFTKLKVHILYQNARDVIRSNSAKELVHAIENIYSQNVEFNKRRADLRKFLVYVKQLHRVFERTPKLLTDPNNRNFDTLMKNFVKI